MHEEDQPNLTPLSALNPSLPTICFPSTDSSTKGCHENPTNQASVFAGYLRNGNIIQLYRKNEKKKKKNKQQL